MMQLNVSGDLALHDECLDYDNAVHISANRYVQATQHRISLDSLIACRAGILLQPWTSTDDLDTKQIGAEQMDRDAHIAGEFFLYFGLSSIFKIVCIMLFHKLCRSL